MRRALLPLLLCATLIVADENADALPRWVPTGTTITEQHRAERMVVIAPAIAQALAEKRVRPAFGLRIRIVRDKTQGSAAGLAVGDVITKLDGVTLPDVSSLNRWRNGKSQILTAWTATAGEREVPITPGMIGLSNEESWSPLHGYLVAREAGAVWENDLILATAAFDDNFQIAEGALLAAQEHGCHHPSWLVVATSLAVQVGRFPEARVFARAALARVAAAERIPVARLLYVALMAGGLVGEAQALVRQYDVLSYEQDHAALQHHLDGAVAPFRSALAAYPVLPLDTLCQEHVEEKDQGRALTYLSGPQQRVAEDLARLDPDGDLVFQGSQRTERLNQAGTLAFKSHRDRLDLTRVGPVMRDLDLALTCTLELDRAAMKTSMGAYAIGIVDHHEADSSIILRLRVTEDSRIQVRVGVMPEYELRRQTFGIDLPHRLRVCMREHTLALLVDDMPVYHGPVLEDPATRKLGLDLYTRDLVGEWSKLTWRGVLTSQELPVPPAKVERPTSTQVTGDNFF